MTMRALVVGIVMGLAQLAPCATSLYSRVDAMFPGVSAAMPIGGDQRAGFFLVKRGLGRALGLGPGAEPQSVAMAGLAFAASMPTRMERSSELSSRNIGSGPSAVAVEPRSPSEILAILQFRWPVHGPISSAFGVPRPPSGTRFHAGIDIIARRGALVRAPADGAVVFVGWQSGYGKTVVVDHGHRVRTLYGHLSRADVRPGQVIHEGTTLGLIGATGHASGPHLHYEVLVNDRPVNPLRTFATTPNVRDRS
jgi:murein DD-endopeptidase MepM/ murein hydrolase activator NlpD